MQADFWHKMWQEKEIGFHESEANSFLVNHFSKLTQGNDIRVMVPLCGKTLDIHWLLAAGHQVVGAELNQTAVTELFEELGVTPDITEQGKLQKYSATNIEIFVGDIFDLTKEEVGAIDVIYDRAALVALPDEMRIRYSKHIVDLTNQAPQLLVVYIYDQNQMDGPPFSLNSSEIERQYKAVYSMEKIESRSVEGGLRGTEATEIVWVLR